MMNTATSVPNRTMTRPDATSSTWTSMRISFAARNTLPVTSAPAPLRLAISTRARGSEMPAPPASLGEGDRVRVRRPPGQTRLAIEPIGIERRTPPRRVAGGRLDLDDVGAEVRQDATRELAKLVGEQNVLPEPNGVVEAERSDLLVPLLVAESTIGHDGHLDRMLPLVGEDPHIRLGLRQGQGAGQVDQSGRGLLLCMESQSAQDEDLKNAAHPCPGLRGL